MSVIVTYDQWGRTGNRLFQYCFGLILSKLRGDAFFYDEIPNFSIEKNTTHKIDNPLYTKSLGNHYADMDLLINYPGDVVVNSYVQQSKYYTPHREMLRHHFKIDEKKYINKNSLVIHVRETDYEVLNAFLGYDFYKKLIKDYPYKDIVIVTDNSNCDTVKRLVQDDNCRLLSPGTVDKFSPILDERGMNDFLTLLYSENIAISQSSFSWMAAFLGNHKKIIFPYKEGIKMWPVSPAKDEIDLYFDFEDTCIKYIR